jgi:hypothetical protein
VTAKEVRVNGHHIASFGSMPMQRESWIAEAESVSYDVGELCFIPGIRKHFLANYLACGERCREFV